MAKKRQLAGKTTKLAKLPLILALVEQSEGSGGAASAATPRETAEPLGALYLHLIRELSFLLSQLQAGPQTLALSPRALLPPHIPQPQEIRLALRLTQQGLQDLQVLLSRD